MSELRLIDASEIVKAAEHAYNEWNLAMAAADGNRQINRAFKMQELCKTVKAVAESATTIDPETLPIVKELRGKLAECETKHGHWIRFSRCDKCSCCGYETAKSEDGGNYCKMCGAKMDEEEGT